MKLLEAQLKTWANAETYQQLLDMVPLIKQTVKLLKMRRIDVGLVLSGSLKPRRLS